MNILVIWRGNNDAQAIFRRRHNAVDTKTVTGRADSDKKTMTSSVLICCFPWKNLVAEEGLEPPTRGL